MGLLRLIPLIIYFIKDKLAGTERAKYRLWAKQTFSFGSNVANHTIILLLGLAFTCLAPLIAPFCLLYFTLALMAQKYQLLYVVTLPYQAAGRMWIDVSTRRAEHVVSSVACMNSTHPRSCACLIWGHLDFGKVQWRGVKDMDLWQAASCSRCLGCCQYMSCTFMPVHSALYCYVRISGPSLA